MDLEDLRSRIDHVDTEIIRLLAERAMIVMEVTEYKRIHNLQPLQRQRFIAMLADRVAKGDKHGLSPVLITDIWTAIHDASVDAQAKAL